MSNLEGVILISILAYIVWTNYKLKFVKKLKKKSVIVFPNKKKKSS